MKNVLITAAIAFLTATSAMASPIIGNNGGDAEASATVGDIRNTANGGNGGAVIGSGNSNASTGPVTNLQGQVSTVDNTVRTTVNTTDVNTNVGVNDQRQRQGQDQGQLQGQLQGQNQTSSSTSGAYQTQSVDNSGNSNNSNTNTNRTGDVTGNSLTGTNTASQSANNDVNVKVDGDTYIAPKPVVSTAYAAPAVIGGGVCAYTPASGSISTRVLGISGSGAKIDPGCQNRANADILARLGYVRQAAALLMQDKNVASAFEVVATAEASEKK